ncbi:hypothetical protein C8R43DRAFT_1108193 [Mycena crocata]|nr:hypothetical protein C8R43DRAFT_1108193 [Mycena crocata]
MLCDSCKIPLLHDALPTPAQVSALRSFLRSTYLLPDLSRYQSEIAASTVILAQYDTEIDRLEQALQDMRGDRSKLQTYVDGCQAAVAPIRRLPLEILGEIFAPFSRSEHGGEREDYKGEAKRLAKSDLLQLSKVCSNWHKLIMGTPSLWSHVREHIDATFLGLLKRSLERGAGHPLTISFCSERNNPNKAAAINLLAEHSRRWQDLYLLVDFSSLAAFSNLRGKLYSLRTVAIISYDINEPSEIVNIFETAPRLTKVTFTAQNSRWCPPLPWHQLHSFVFDARFTAYVAALLGLINVPHLDTRFEVRNFQERSRGPDEQLTTTITSAINSLLLTARHTGGEWHWAIKLLGEALDCLTLPRLRDLSLNSYSSRSPMVWSMPAFTALSLRSSFCNTLRSLDIRYIVITGDDLIHSLASLASLRQLVISDQLNEEILVTDALLRRLALAADLNSCLVPQLEFLDCTSLFQFSAEAYLDFAMSRITHGTALLQGVLRDFSDGSCQFEVANHQTLLDFVAEHISNAEELQRH